MMEVVGIIMSFFGEIKDIVKGVGSLVSKWKERKKAILSDMNGLKAVLNRCGFIDDTEQINKKYDNFPTPRRTRKLLPELVKYIREYNKWLDGSKRVFYCETTLIYQRERVKELNQQFVMFKKGDLQSAVTSRVGLYVLNGTINVEQCKEDLLQAYNRDCRTEDGSDTLIGFCDSERFHEFVDALKEIQERPSIEAFREAKRGTLGIVEEIERALKK